MKFVSNNKNNREIKPSNNKNKNTRGILLLKCILGGILYETYNALRNFFITKNIK